MKRRNKVKKILLIIMILLLATIIATAKLSDETIETVNKLSIKHYGHGIDLTFMGLVSISDNTIEWNRDFLSIWVKDGKLYVETQDGKWCIKMKEVTE